MCRIVTASHAGKEKGQAALAMAELCDFMNDPRGRGLIAIPDEKANHALLKELFNERLCIPVSRFYDGFDRQRVDKAVEIANKYTARLIATNDVLYHAKGRRPLQDALTCVREGVNLTDAGFKLLANGE